MESIQGYYIGFASLSLCEDGQSHAPRLGQYKGRDCIYCSRCKRFFSYAATTSKSRPKPVDAEELQQQGGLLE